MTESDPRLDDTAQDDKSAQDKVERRGPANPGIKKDAGGQGYVEQASDALEPPKAVIRTPPSDPVAREDQTCKTKGKEAQNGTG